MQAVMGAKDAYVPLVSKNELSVTLPKSLDDSKLICVTETYNRYEFAPLLQGREAGRISYYIGDELIASSPIIVAHSVKRYEDDENKNIFDKIKDFFS